MKKLIGSLIALSLFVPLFAFADSTITTQPDMGSAITPSTALILTGQSLSFGIAALSNFVLTDVTFDGASQGVVSHLSVTGDTSNHTIASFSRPTGGASPYCSSNTAPGYTVGAPHGGPNCPLNTPTWVPFNTSTSMGLCMFSQGCMIPKN